MYVANIKTDRLDRRLEYRYDYGMEPARSIIEKLGGDTAVAKILGVHRTRVAAWKSPKGSNGRIPFWHVPKLIDVARARGVPLSADDFLPSDPSQFDRRKAS